MIFLILLLVSCCCIVLLGGGGGAEPVCAGGQEGTVVEALGQAFGLRRGFGVRVFANKPRVVGFQLVRTGPRERIFELNPDHPVVESLQEEFPTKKWHLVLGVMGDKNVELMVERLAPLLTRLVDHERLRSTLQGWDLATTRRCWAVLGTTRSWWQPICSATEFTSNWNMTSCP